MPLYLASSVSVSVACLVSVSALQWPREQSKGVSERPSSVRRVVAAATPQPAVVTRLVDSTNSQRKEGPSYLSFSFSYLQRLLFLLVFILLPICYLSLSPDLPLPLLILPPGCIITKYSIQHFFSFTRAKNYGDPKCTIIQIIQTSHDRVKP